MPHLMLTGCAEDGHDTIVSVSIGAKKHTTQSPLRDIGRFCKEEPLKHRGNNPVAKWALD